MEVVKDGEKIADLSSPGAVFGELAILLDQPHGADVRTLEQSEFYVADASAMLAGDPSVALYIAAILARRSTPPIERLSRSSINYGASPSVIGETVEKIEEVLGFGGDASLVYAGYPFDPFRSDKSMH